MLSSGPHSIAMSMNAAECGGIGHLKKVRGRELESSIVARCGTPVDKVQMDL